MNETTGEKKNKQKGATQATQSNAKQPKRYLQVLECHERGEVGDSVPGKTQPHHGRQTRDPIETGQATT